MISRKRIIKYWHLGKSKNWIAGKLRCSRTFVYKVLTEEGLYKPKRKRKTK